MRLGELQTQMSSFFKGSVVESSPRLWQDLLGFHLSMSWSDLFMKKDWEVPEHKRKSIEQDALALKQGKPLAYIIGEQFFFKHSFVVDPRVLIPRPETEILVERALGFLPPRGGFADLGTGSGCVGLSVAKESPSSQGILIDTSSSALQVARINQQRLKLENIRFVQSHLRGSYFY